MSFFGITQLGFQNYVREHSVLAKEDPPRATQQLGFVALPPIKDKNPPQRAIVPINQTSGYGPGHEGSYVELTRMRTKHLRNPTAPQSLYFYPPTTNSEPGWWTKDRPLYEKRPWTHVPRKPCINSEMTRFVDTMAMTNRQFTLY
ncbi:sperm microtubule inner protein 11-like [Babylonia areolata]|uniref:sperm microtubule inner protein 11-like n=1 Tax=Babylonia areolata TaxID=304850 RepID=UPI003FD3A942